MPVDYTKHYRVDKKTGCWNWTGYHYAGYGRMYSEKTKETVNSYKYFFEKNKGIVPKGGILDHLCKNKSCVNPNHLEIVTPAENTRRGLVAKISLRDVIKIRDLYNFPGLRQGTLSKIFGVNSPQICRIVNYRRWL